MSLYHYRAYNAAGQTVSGAVEADGLLTVEARLRATGLWLLEAKEGGGLISSESNGITIKRADLVTFVVQMSLLLRAGITLPSALDRLTEDFKDTKLGTVLATLREKVAIGMPLNQSMAAYPKVFSAETMAIVQAGEVSGKLPEVFESLTGYYEWLDGLVGEIRQALIYPLMVIGASMALVVMLFTFVVPKFVGLLTDLNLQVPLLTRIVMVISNALVNGWPVLLLIIVGIPVGFKLAMRSPAFACSFAILHGLWYELHHDEDEA